MTDTEQDGGAGQRYRDHVKANAGRLIYASFVSRPHHYIYVETPKAACTAIKRLLVDVEGVPFDPRARPYFRETRIDMFVHQRRHIAMPTLLDLTPEELEAALEGQNGWFVFAMCRNPYSRLVSVFENKVRNGEPNYGELAARFGDPRPHGGLARSFHAFVEAVIADKERSFIDPHFRPQSDLLLPHLIPYTRVFPVESVDLALEAFRAHLATQGVDRPLVLERINPSPKRNWRSFFDEATAARVAEAYAVDFDRFGYDPDDWRAPPGVPPAEETEEERYWREQVTARNELISFLYDIILKKP